MGWTNGWYEGPNSSMQAPSRTAAPSSCSSRATLGQKTGLARARLSADEDDLPNARHGVAPGRFNGGELSGAADEHPARGT